MKTVLDCKLEHPQSLKETTCHKSPESGGGGGGGGVLGGGVLEGGGRHTHIKDW